MKQTKHMKVTGEQGTFSVQFVWTPDPRLPGVFDITVIQERGTGDRLQRHWVEISLCKKTFQRIIDEIFRDTPKNGKYFSETELADKT